MTTKSAKTEEPAVGLPWRRRAQYDRVRTRKQRQDQYRAQMNVLGTVLLVAVIAAGLFIYANWLQTGSTKLANCTDFPEFCVPHAGGVSGSSALANLEAPGIRELDGESTAAPGVVRGVNSDFMPYIGDPDAPIQFALMADYACPHCQDYHASDYKRFVEDYVLTGQATMAIGLLTGTGGQYSQTASVAALCAGEQGAFWEFNEELFRLAESMGASSAFSLSQLQDSAQDMGLDWDAMRSCIASGRYDPVMQQHTTVAVDAGVTGTPTVLVRRGNEPWRQMLRDYANLAAVTEQANNDTE